ncbi:MAG TPA: MBL fold metallo-hydrolase, partial [Candidatus Limnocylindrales bacterium]|nr:MBL fold metallo-hydrolase [Candidatus Limnocylindrales bacterium]
LMDLHFLGGATTVTGSQFLLETRRARVLVDCGMFQGGPHEAIRNRVPFAFDPAGIDAVVLTHAHLDHCGLLPVLVREGYRGSIHATDGTVELAELVLRDSGRLQEEFAERAERRARRDPDRAAARERRDLEALEDAVELAEQGGSVDGERDLEDDLRAGGPEADVDLDAPLYTEADARRAATAFRGLRYDVEREVAPGVHATLLDAGHILGSAIVRLRIEAEDGEPARTIVFSGDLGRPNTPIIRDPTPLAEADYVICETTYGGREHEPQREAIRILAETVRLVAEHEGVLLVPAFAIGRTQELVWTLDRLIEAGEIPLLPLFLDSPMASEATSIYRRHAGYFDETTRRLLETGSSPLDYPRQKTTNRVAQSKAIARARRPYMIVASSGMLTGGRVLAHLRDLIDDPDAVLLFVGYQGEGTLGAHLQAGARTIRLDGQERAVRCAIRTISGFSAHADESELLDWLGNFVRGRSPGDPGVPRRVFLVHGDPEAQVAIEPKVRALGFDTLVPRWRQRVPLD